MRPPPAPSPAALRANPDFCGLPIETVVNRHNADNKSKYGNQSLFCFKNQSTNATIIIKKKDYQLFHQVQLQVQLVELIG